MPKFVYFPDYEKMPGQVSVEQLLRKRQSNQLSFSDRIFLALLDLAQRTPEELQQAGKFEEFIARVEAVSNRITDEIFKYWSQNQDLRVEFRLDPARPQDPPPFNQGHVFRTRVEKTRHRVTVSFDQRSAGFVWFFSFLVWFSQVRKNYGERLVILLDEPAVSLLAV